MLIFRVIISTCILLRLHWAPAVAMVAKEDSSGSPSQQHCFQGLPGTPGLHGRDGIPGVPGIPGSRGDKGPDGALSQNERREIDKLKSELAKMVNTAKDLEDRLSVIENCTKVVCSQSVKMRHQCFSSAVGERDNPAESCKEIKFHDPHSQSGIYWLKTPLGNPYRTYCEMTVDGGGFTFVASIAEGTGWEFHSRRWTEINVFNDDLLLPLRGTKVDRKVTSYNVLPLKEVMITDQTLQNYHVMFNFKDSDLQFSSLRDAFANGENYLWANRKTSRGSGMWNSPNWAFNNVDPTNHCYDGRIAVCKQTKVIHTGGGTLIGISCPPLGKTRDVNLFRSLFSQTYTCNGETRSLSIAPDSYYNIFVR